MVNVIGVDIGGANIKVAWISTQKGEVKDVKVAVEYFPVWKNRDKLAGKLLRIKESFCRDRLDGVGLTMTAELSDAYQTKREGINHILSSAKQAFGNVSIFVLNVDAELLSVDDAKKEPLKVASANWAATVWLVAQHVKNCVLVDVGSTSTSIIPIVGGQISAKGKTDLAKLMCGELVYTGSLRTNVAAIVNFIPIQNQVAKVSSELFALSGDVHLVLNHISIKDYTSETADGRGKTKKEALARLARVVCADVEMLTKQEITGMAQYISDRQIQQVAEGLNQVYSRVKSLTSKKEVTVVITGLGKEFIAKKAAQSIGVDKIVDLGDLMHGTAVLASPAVGVALMTASKLEGETIQWK